MDGFLLIIFILLIVFALLFSLEVYNEKKVAKGTGELTEPMEPETATV